MRSLAALLCLGFALFPLEARSQTLTVLSSNATKGVVEELGPQFEKANTQKVVFTFGNSAELKARIEKGEAFDVAILTAPVIGELISTGKLVPATRTDIARAGAGMAIHAQATKPDISTADALKGALIRARSIAYVGQGATAVIMRSIFEKFGITEAMNAKTVLVASAAHAVAAKEAELGFTQVSEILNVSGAALAGPLPPEVQVYTTFQAATSAGSTLAIAAQQFIRFLTAPAAGPVIRTKGMEPVSSTTQDRMPPIAEAQMTAAQKQAAADFKTARGVDMSGPFYPLLRSPELMTRARAMGDYLRFKSALPPRLSELVILMTAREWTQQYEWNAHYQIALKAGLDPQIAQAIAEGRRPTTMADDEAILYEFCQELHRNKSVGDATYARAVAKFGEQAVIDTVGITGYYTMLAMVLNTARTPSGPSTAPTLRPLPR
jgi:4-carboxymuconolactone decarboxylase